MADRLVDYLLKSLENATDSVDSICRKQRECKDCPIHAETKICVLVRLAESNLKKVKEEHDHE